MGGGKGGCFHHAVRKKTALIRQTTSKKVRGVLGVFHKTGLKTWSSSTPCTSIEEGQRASIKGEQPSPCRQRPGWSKPEALPVLSHALFLPCFLPTPATIAPSWFLFPERTVSPLQRKLLRLLSTEFFNWEEWGVSASASAPWQLMLETQADARQVGFLCSHPSGYQGPSW